MHSATIMSFFVINDIIRFMRMHAPIYAPISHIHKESVKSVHSSRSTRASQSPNKVEKQPKSTPDMYNPPTRITRARTSLFNTYPRGHSSLLSGLYSLECCEDSVESQTTSINAFYVTAFFTLSVPAIIFCLQNYCFFLNSASLFVFLSRYRLKWFI